MAPRQSSNTGTGFVAGTCCASGCIGKIYNRFSNRKFVPVGIIPSNQTPFSFPSDKCELTV